MEDGGVTTHLLAMTTTSASIPRLRVPNYISLETLSRRYPVQSGVVSHGPVPKPEVEKRQPLRQFILDSPAKVFAARRLRNCDFEGPKTQPAWFVEQQRLMRTLPDFWERPFSSAPLASR